MADGDIDILIVEDSRSEAMAISRLLSRFNVIGIARSGQEALGMLERLKPDVITMDIHLPDIDGLELTRQILQTRRVPIVVVSALAAPERQNPVFEALCAGAYDVVPKSRLFPKDGSSAAVRKLIDLVRTAATKKLRPGRRSVAHPAVGKDIPPARPARREMIAVGASTGGPAALHRVFAEAESDFPLPVLVAQHMAQGFIEGFVHWLKSQTRAEVRIAARRERPRPGVIYFPPSGHHLILAPDGGLRLEPGDDSHYCPSVDRLFVSVAEVFGEKAICLLLTGMGSDGAKGLLAARQQEALTAVQDQATSVVYGMPMAALRLGAASQVLSLPEILPWLLRHAGGRQDRRIVVDRR